MKISKLSVLFMICLFAVSASAQKMKPEDILAKHLDSIGTEENRAATKSLIAVGSAEVKSITKITTPVVGRIVIASAGMKIFWGMNLNSTDYPSEKFSYTHQRISLMKRVNFVECRNDKN